MSLSFFLYCYATHPPLNSFPTRRSSDLLPLPLRSGGGASPRSAAGRGRAAHRLVPAGRALRWLSFRDRKSTRLNSSHLGISYAVFCLKKKKTKRATI